MARLQTPACQKREDGRRKRGRERKRRGTGREWWGGTPVNRYKISSAIFPGKFSAAIVKRRPPPPRVFIAKSICETRVRGQECRCCESLYPRWNARSAHSGHRRRLLRGGPAGWGKEARAVVGRGDDPSALSAYHRVFVGLVRYATAWSETTRRTRFETSFAKRPPPGWSRGEEGRREGGGRGGERATVNYPSATSPNWTRSGSGRRKRRKEKEDLFLSCVRTVWDDDDDDSTLSLWRRRGRATGRRIIFLWKILRVFLSWQFSVGFRWATSFEGDNNNF